MERNGNVIQNKEGFTLVEVLVAMVVLLLGLLASLFGVMTALDHNLANAMRNEAMTIAQQQMENARSTRYEALVDGDTSSQVQRQFRKAQRTFDVNTNVTAVDNIKRIIVTVQWTLKNRTHSFSLESIVREPI
ncbi:MAG: prepilin-type N-terminal cleavage/methylation domain-containing protein [Deltaproteobacteria bacterium]|jgi:type IV pilus assembly protein PilV|nr:prepilin-type N-terminal cleavage/methylation domain-containing protein [Deltaproteobacteria bacterium]